MPWAKVPNQTLLPKVIDSWCFLRGCFNNHRDSCWLVTTMPEAIVISHHAGFIFIFYTLLPSISWHQSCYKIRNNYDEWSEGLKGNTTEPTNIAKFRAATYSLETRLKAYITMRKVAHRLLTIATQHYLYQIETWVIWIRFGYDRNKWYIIKLNFKLLKIIFYWLFFIFILKFYIIYII